MSWLSIFQKNIFGEGKLQQAAELIFLILLCVPIPLKKSGLLNKSSTEHFVRCDLSFSGMFNHILWSSSVDESRLLIRATSKDKGELKHNYFTQIPPESFPL